jgi:hypothetical protein
MATLLYIEKYNLRIYFRLISVDYSWALIHSVLHAFNGETIDEYMHRVYLIATGAKKIDHVKSWLIS